LLKASTGFGLADSEGWREINALPRSNADTAPGAASGL